jgi:ER membrane protein complex subunit 6
MAATGGVSTDDIPILQAENLTSNVKSVHYRYVSLSQSDLEVRLV